jgi:uncharacterized protein (UPF0332 family)
LSFAQDLLEQAQHLVDWDGANPKQANLRRAVSTAYYALFHLLIDEAVNHWGIARHRGRLARTFDHGSIKRVCDDYVRSFYSAGKPASERLLKDVAETFSELQLNRHTADYDNSFIWTKADAEEWIARTGVAFTCWDTIRTQDAAQDFLLSLFLPKLTRPQKNPPALKQDPAGRSSA